MRSTLKQVFGYFIIINVAFTILAVLIGRFGIKDTGIISFLASVLYFTIKFSKKLISGP